MFSRYASAISTSTIMTLGLIFIMQTLIEIQPGAMSENRHRHLLVPVRVPEPDDPVRTIDHTIDKTVLIDNILPPDTNVDHSAVDTVGVALPKQTVLTGPQISDVGYSDGPLVTMINVQPAYPIRAIQNEIEGHVIVEFDVDENGRAINIRVVETTHQVFVKSALKAAERIKFKARVVDGNPVMTTGVRKLFRYELEKD